MSWFRNNSFLLTNESVTEANYVLHADEVGEHNVSAVAANAIGTDMQTWIWNVTEAPLAPPNITSFAPPSPVSDTVCNWRTFSYGKPNGKRELVRERVIALYEP